MSVLRDPRLELFVHGLAKGLSRKAAYAEAGYEGDPEGQMPNYLARKREVKERLAQLLGNAAAKAELTRAHILHRMYEDWDTARKLGQMPAALKAAELIGRELHKMFTERKEVGGPGDFDNKTEEELHRIITEGLKDLGWDKPADPDPDQPPAGTALN